jgi:hypothetical protein
MDSSEFVPTSNEVLHENHFDILENNRQTTIDKEEMQRLVAKVRQEVEKATPGNPLPSWNKFGIEGNLLVDNAENPKYIAKRKWVSPDHLEMMLAIPTDRATATGRSLERKKYMYATDSILSEMSLSKEIKEVVNSKEIQETFLGIGYDSFEYIEPLMGIIDQETKEKRVIYKYVDGENIVDYYVKDGGYPEGTFGAISKLTTALTQKGIIPHDLNITQFVVSDHESGSKSLHLIDAEMYFRK